MANGHLKDIWKCTLQTFSRKCLWNVWMCGDDRVLKSIVQTPFSTSGWRNSSKQTIANFRQTERDKG